MSAACFSSACLLRLLTHPFSAGNGSSACRFVPPRVPAPPLPTSPREVDIEAEAEAEAEVLADSDEAVLDRALGLTLRLLKGWLRDSASSWGGLGRGRRTVA